jgi:hypothetical protein
MTDRFKVDGRTIAHLRPVTCNGGKIVTNHKDAQLERDNANDCSIGYFVESWVISWDMGDVFPDFGHL